MGGCARFRVHATYRASYNPFVPACSGHCIAVDQAFSRRRWGRRLALGKLQVDSQCSAARRLRAAAAPTFLPAPVRVLTFKHRAGGRQHSAQHIRLGVLRQLMLPAGRAQARRARRRRAGACLRCRSCSARWRSARRLPRRRPRRCCRSAARASIWSHLCPGAAGGGSS